MSKLKKYVLVVAVMTFVLGLVGCGIKSDKEQVGNEGVATQGVEATIEPTQEATAEPTQEVTVEPTQGTNQTENSKTVTYPLTIQNSDGTSVVIETEPERIVSLAPSITEMLYALGVEDKLVGRTDYCEYPEAAKDKPSVGSMSSPDVETIISLEPDLVIASTHFSEETKEQLAKLGIKVASLYEEHQVEGVYDIVEKVALICNVTEVGTSITNEMKDLIVDTTSRVEGMEKPSVYYVVGYGEYGDYTAGGDTFISGLITLAGGDNIAKDVEGWSYSLESLVEADPDIILLRIGEKDAFITADTYKDLSAVKNNQVYEIDGDLLELQGVRNAKGVRALAEIFYPEVFLNK